MFKERRRINKRSESRRASRRSQVELDDCKRFLLLLRQQCEKNVLSLPRVNNYILRPDKLSVNIIENLANEEFTDLVQLDVYYAVAGLKLNKVDIKIRERQIIQMPLFDSIVNTILCFATLNTLKLNNCKLTDKHISFLAENLQNKNCILTEISLNFNPNKEENFYKLINVGLKILSLSFCKITVKGLKLIAKEFVGCPVQEATLVHLDLSHNWVFAEGAEFVANIIRCNRTLTSLNIADCKIGDEGFKKIAEGFATFILNEDELYERRKLRYQYFRFKSVIGGLIVDENDEFTKVKYTMNIHPFVGETMEDGDELKCKGNWVLRSINISYNNLTKTSLQQLLTTVKTQATIFGANKGLKWVLYDGIRCDKNDDCDDLKDELDGILLGKNIKMSILGIGETQENDDSLLNGTITEA